MLWKLWTSNFASYSKNPANVLNFWGRFSVQNPTKIAAWGWFELGQTTSAEMLLQNFSIGWNKFFRHNDVTISTQIASENASFYVRHMASLEIGSWIFSAPYGGVQWLQARHCCAPYSGRLTFSSSKIMRHMATLSGGWVNSFAPGRNT